MASDPTSVFSGDSELAVLVRAKDWSATPVGPIETWPPALVTAVGVLLASRFAMWMLWGDDRTMFYNDAYRRDTLGKKHPEALGRPANEVWSEVWSEVEGSLATLQGESAHDGSLTHGNDELTERRKRKGA